MGIEWNILSKDWALILNRHLDAMARVYLVLGRDHSSHL